MTLATDLDGKYSVTSQGGPGGSYKQSDGFTIIRNGQTLRIDGNGCEWRSTFEWTGDKKVKMVSVVDPKYAVDNFQLIGPDGRPTTQPLTYETTLTVKGEGDLVQLNGVITTGEGNISLIMRKVGTA